MAPPSARPAHRVVVLWLPRAIVNMCFCLLCMNLHTCGTLLQWETIRDDVRFSHHSLIFPPPSTWMGMCRSTPRKKECTLAELELRGCSSHYRQHRESATLAVPLSQGALSLKSQWRNSGLQSQLDIVHKPLRISDRSYDTLAHPPPRTGVRNTYNCSGYFRR